jgi:hypothetical protein
MSHQAGPKALQKAPSNEWIAFSEDDERLIACGATYDEVIANAEKQGAFRLVVVKVPETWIYRVSVANGHGVPPVEAGEEIPASIGN